MRKKSRESWKNYCDHGQDERAIWHLMNIDGYSRRAAELRVKNYKQHEAKK